MSLKAEQEQKQFLTIIGGKLKTKANEYDQGAVLRKYELKDGTKGEKWEKSYRSVSGLISNIEFKEGDYGVNCNIHIDDLILSVSVTNSGKVNDYFSTFAKILPNINLDQEVILSPYDFTDDKGKRRKGISVKQNEEKLKNAYYDGVKNIKGFPGLPIIKDKKAKGGERVATREDMDGDDWDIYFNKTIKKFLVNEIEAMVFPGVLPVTPEAETVSNEAEKTFTEAEAKAQDGEINPEILPF